MFSVSRRKMTGPPGQSGPVCHGAVGKSMTPDTPQEVFVLRRFCVTVMDNFTPARRFWSRRLAIRYRDKIGAHAFLYEWYDGRWLRIG
jgi:hypothetical protein